MINSRARQIGCPDARDNQKRGQGNQIVGSGCPMGNQGLGLNTKGDDRGDPTLTKRICGFDSQLLLGPVIPKTLKTL